MCGSLGYPIGKSLDFGIRNPNVWLVLRARGNVIRAKRKGPGSEGKQFRQARQARHSDKWQQPDLTLADASVSHHLARTNDAKAMPDSWFTIQSARQSRRRTIIYMLIQQTIDCRVSRVHSPFASRQTGDKALPNTDRTMGSIQSSSGRERGAWRPTSARVAANAAAPGGFHHHHHHQAKIQVIKLNESVESHTHSRDPQASHTHKTKTVHTEVSIAAAQLAAFSAKLFRL